MILLQQHFENTLTFFSFWMFFFFLGGARQDVVSIMCADIHPLCHHGIVAPMRCSAWEKLLDADD